MESNALDYELVEQLLKSGDSKPLKIQIDPEGSCNHNCIFCNYRNVGWDLDYFDSSWFDGRKEKVVPGKSGLSWPVMDRLIQSIKHFKVPDVEITGGGEPTIYPYIKETLEGLGRTDAKISLVTNGSNLQSLFGYIPNNLEWVRVSLDAATSKTHAIVHRSKGYARIIKTLNTFKASYPKIPIYISFCIVPENMDEILIATAKYKDMGFDGIKFNAIYTPAGDGSLSEDMVPKLKNITKEAEFFADETFKVKNSFWKIDKYDENVEFGACYFGRFMVAIGYNGLVYPCCIVKNRADYEYGNLNEAPLEDIISQNTRKYQADTCPPCWSRDHNIKMKKIIDNV